MMYKRGAADWPWNLLEEVFITEEDLNSLRDNPPLDFCATLEYQILALSARAHSSAGYERMPYILYAYYRDGQTLREIGEQFGLKAERIRQIKAKALRLLRHPRRRRALQLGLQNSHQMDIEEQTESNLRVHKENEVRVRDIAFKEGYAQGLKDASSPQHNLSNSQLAVDKNAELLYAADVDLTDIPLSVRAYNGLTRAGIKTVGDIALAHEKTNGLTSVWGLGVKTIDEIAQVLKSRYGITLPASEAELSILKSGKNEEPSQA